MITIMGTTIPDNFTTMGYVSKSNSVAYDDLLHKHPTVKGYTGAYVTVQPDGTYSEVWVTDHAPRYSIHANYRKVI